MVKLSVGITNNERDDVEGRKANNKIPLVIVLFQNRELLSRIRLSWLVGVKPKVVFSAFKQINLIKPRLVNFLGVGHRNFVSIGVLGLHQSRFLMRRIGGLAGHGNQSREGNVSKRTIGYRMISSCFTNSQVNYW